jgi:hypothetical protein
MTGALQLLEMPSERIADAALPESGDVLVQLAVLPAQRGNCHPHDRLDVPQVKNCVFERPGMSDPTSLKYE